MTMVEQQYLAQGLAHPDDLSGTANLSDRGPTTVSAPPASAYPDLTPYGTVSSSPFSLPGQCDSNLLTPISAAGSPPLHQARKLISQYPPPPSTPGAQQPTPPGSSKMYHQQSQWSQFDMNGQPTQTSSPMAHQAPVAPEYMEATYLPEGRRTTPGPPEPYMGAFGVSDAPESQHMNQPYYMMGHPVDHHIMLREQQQQPMPMAVTGREMHTAPLLNDPHPSQFRPARRPSPEDQVPHGLTQEPRSSNGSPRRRPVSAASGRVKKRSAKPRGQVKNPGTGDPLEDHKNCFGIEVPPNLKSNCPEEERCIFESRWRHRHQKGQDMWESIQNDFNDRFHKCPGKETLQMKFKRGRGKYYDWIPRDVEILHQAWIANEKDRYQNILDRFIEMGGSRNMRLNPSDIEIKVVNDLKLEEGLYMESHGDANIRRRRKSTSVRKRTTMRGMDDALSDELSISSHNTHEDEVINQVHSRRGIKLEDDSVPGQNEMMDIQMWADQPGGMPQRHEPMSHQPGEQMIRLSPGAQYGRRRES